MSASTASGSAPTAGCNLKGLALDLVQRNGEVSIPFVLSDRGYGMLWNSPAVGRVEFAENATRWQAGQAREIDYWFTAAPTPTEILARYADATGHAPELPAWASGFWQSKLRYRTQDELLEVAREYHRRGLPLSVIVADFFHWSAMGDYRFDPAEWPDPDAMVAELRELGVELMVSIWPTVSPLSENYGEFYQRGLLAGADQGVEFQQTIQDKGMDAPMPVAFYDPTNPATREYVWSLVERNYLSRGIRVFWLDACEPELNPAHPGNLSLYAGPGAEVAGIYPRDNARLFAAGMAAAGQEQTVLLCRSAWAGSQRYGAAVWSGDIPATWESLRVQVRAGLSIAISGIPWWTTDIGGFHGGDPSDPAYQELIVRWFQYGVFCPLFRLHGDRQPRVPTGFEMTGGPNEAWSYGDAAYQRIAAALRLRERLRPYIHQQMRVASRQGVPPMRPLFLDFPDDPDAWQVEDEFLFGPDLLIAPVLEPGASRPRRLPARRPGLDRGGDRSQARRRAHRRGSPVRRPHSRLRHRRIRGTRCRPLRRAARCGRPASVWRPLGVDEIRITGGMWGQKQRLNADTILQHCESWMERIGWIGNFDRAAADMITGSHAGIEFVDSEVYKLLEAMAWELGRAPSDILARRYQVLVERVAAAQEPDGYLHTSFGRAGQPPRYSSLESGHELYCFGHLLQAAVARLRTGHDDVLPQVARRLADHVYRQFGPDGRVGVCGHPEIEMALVEFARATGEKRYLELARLFIERRGDRHPRPPPVRPGILPRRHPGPPGDDDAGPRRARALPRRGRAGRGDRDRRRRSWPPPCSGNGRTGWRTVPTSPAGSGRITRTRRSVMTSSSRRTARTQKPARASPR